MACRGVTAGPLLGGRVQYAQPRDGYRSGIEPVLLAASIPAKRGERVLEGGSGAGATLLCLAARVAGVGGMGVERDASLAALARRNAAANGWRELWFIAADVGALPVAARFDHACANPPYHPAGSTPSPDTSRRAAKQATDGLVRAWTAALGAPLRPRGTLTFVIPAALLAAGIAAFMEAGCQPDAVLPLWPRVGRQAKLVLLRGVKASKPMFRVLPGLVLHRPDGGYTEEAQSILRDGAPLAL